jgi:NAD-dependent deacetylase
MESWVLPGDARVLVLTGAGVSAESGVPTFRGSQGLWEGHRIEEVASPEGFEANPELVWRFYGLRREGASKVTPNAGHLALARLEASVGDRFLLATQNVDGLHARAGSRRMLAIHGELFESRCVACAEPFADRRADFSGGLPRCARCGALVRPNIVWFGEFLDPAHLAKVEGFMTEAGRRLVFLAVGTSGQVYPAGWSTQRVRSAARRGWSMPRLRRASRSASTTCSPGRAARCCQSSSADRLQRPWAMRRITTPAICMPKIEVTKATEPSIWFRCSQEWNSFSPCGHTHMKPPWASS